MKIIEIIAMIFSIWWFGSCIIIIVIFSLTKFIENIRENTVDKVSKYSKEKNIKVVSIIERILYILFCLIVFLSMLAGLFIFFHIETDSKVILSIRLAIIVIIDVLVTGNTWKLLLIRHSILRLFIKLKYPRVLKPEMDYYIDDDEKFNEIRRIRKLYNILNESAKKIDEFIL